MRRSIGLTVMSVLFVVLALATGASAASVAVPLGTAASFSVLAGAGISNTGPTTVSGDIGTFPTTSITGLGSLTVGGANHAGDAVTQQAKVDLATAYSTAASEGPTNPVTGDLGGLTLLPGVYNSASSIGLTGALTLNAQGNPDAVFVFQMGSTLTSASGSVVNLINGAQACNVFWQVGSSATLGTGSAFVGTVMAGSSVTVTTGVTVAGRVLAQNGAVTLDTDTITTSMCATSSGSSTPGATTPTAPTTTTPGTTTAPGLATPSTTTPSSTPSPAATKRADKKRAVAEKKATLEKGARKKTVALSKRRTTAMKTPVAKITAKPKPPVHVFGLTG